MPPQPKTTDIVSHTRKVKAYGPHSDNQKDRNNTPETANIAPITNSKTRTNPLSDPAAIIERLLLGPGLARSYCMCPWQ
ncbi:hypothetical protein CN173_34005 [Sinorhizobium meliloti]|nr:hypothetical protein CN173_34005 [Sinorhizobium meliloti]